MLCDFFDTHGYTYLCKEGTAPFHLPSVEVDHLVECEWLSITSENAATKYYKERLVCSKVKDWISRCLSVLKEPAPVKE